MTCISINKRFLLPYGFQEITLWKSDNRIYFHRVLEVGCSILNSPRDSRYFDLNIFLVFVGSSRRTSSCYSKTDHECFVLLTSKLHGEKLTDSRIVSKFPALSTASRLNIS